MTEKKLDFRNLGPEEYHTAVFRAFDLLAIGEAFTVVVEHDPKSLFRQFKTQRSGSFRWEYTEKGPLLWQVCIAKSSETNRAEEGCCGICGTN